MEKLKAKTAEDLNLIIAKHLDILDGTKVTADDIRKAESIANLIGKQLKTESIRIAYEGLYLKSGKTYGFMNPPKGS
jgi:hypothetical protein